MKKLLNKPLGFIAYITDPSISWVSAESFVYFSFMTSIVERILDLMRSLKDLKETLKTLELFRELKIVAEIVLTV